ncbi:MAG: hypothetical protein LBT05_02640, partial [Planctomycetaceae bacterium]|nr:hypothetical protein [Planctomycetaceae bacterium]
MVKLNRRLRSRAAIPKISIFGMEEYRYNCDIMQLLKILDNIVHFFIGNSSKKTISPEETIFRLFPEKYHKFSFAFFINILRAVLITSSLLLLYKIESVLYDYLLEFLVRPFLLFIPMTQLSMFDTEKQLE